MQDPQLWVGYGLAISLLLAIVLSIFCIFLYNDRKNQTFWIKRTMLFQLIGAGFAVGVLFSLGGIGRYLWDEAIGTGLTLLALLFHGLALRFIKKDEDLVRSIDRIR